MEYIRKEDTFPLTGEMVIKMTFKDLEGLKQYLKMDSEKVSLNPVRFISVDSMKMWTDAKTLLLSISDESLFLSEFCEGNDTTPNINRVSTVLKKSAKSQLVTPLSEYLRIRPEIAEQTILKFIKADYTNNDSGRLRIYFLMYRMKNLLMALPKDDPRQKDCVIFLETDEESDYRLTIIQKELDVKLSGNEITGFKNYLKYWESNPDKPLILHTENAVHFEKNHFFDDVHVIVSSYDLIKYQYGLVSEVTEELGTTDNWNDLLRIIIEEGSFDEACCAVMTINKYSLSLYKNWTRYSDFQKWLLWLWTRLQPRKSYITKCAQSGNLCDQFVDFIYCGIISEINNDFFEDVYEERRDILALMKSVPTERFWEEISKLSVCDSLSCLTCLTDIERKTIFEIISGIEYHNRSGVLKKLKIVYPQLYHYLCNDEQPNRANLTQVHRDYFDEYKWLKATNNITCEFVKKVKTIANEKGSSVFKLNSRDYCVANKYDENTAILFVDGMGAEYIDYLVYLFSDLDNKKYSCIFEVGYCMLPSDTKFNNGFMEGRNMIDPLRRLDELKHSNIHFPDSLINQLDILDNIKDCISGLFAGKVHKIIIASDHGTSRLAVRVRNTEFDTAVQKPQDTEIYNYGRFCNATKYESDYPTAISYNDYLIFADYTRFIQQGAPIDEMHGGASLEEWLVPIITIEKYADKCSDKVVVNPVIQKYKPELGTKQIKVRFTVSGKKRDNVYVNIKGTRISCEFENEEYNFFYIPAKEESSVTVTVIDGGVLGKFNIEIEQGIKKNVKFDI